MVLKNISRRTEYDNIHRLEDRIINKIDRERLEEKLKDKECKKKEVFP